ncbi:MAG: hypothetical protein AAF211_00420 [Myxococcota bacterium]
MSRPGRLFVAAAGLAYEAHDGDGDFYVLPLVEQIPAAPDTPVARADASAGALVAVALFVTLLNLRHWLSRTRDPDEPR